MSLLSMKSFPRAFSAASLSAAILVACPSSAGEIVFKEGLEYSNPDGQHLQLNLARPKERQGLAPAILCILGVGFRAGERGRCDKLC